MGTDPVAERFVPGAFIRSFITEGIILSSWLEPGEQNTYRGPTITVNDLCMIIAALPSPQGYSTRCLIMVCGDPTTIGWAYAHHFLVEYPYDAHCENGDA